MANLRTGLYGTYCGSYFNESKHLTDSEMKTNATYLQKALSARGWTKNAIAAILGNMQAESSINPGRWQSDSVGSYSLGYGLVQWTPVTKYTDWCTSNGYSDPSEIDANVARIIYEVENRIQWYATAAYDMTFKEFTTSSQDCGTLAKAFLLNYERPADQSSSVQEYRASLARNWYTYLSDGSEPDIPIIIPTNKRKKHRFNFILFNARNRRIKRGKT